MKTFGRRIFNALLVFSLLLCLATVLFWVRSYWITDFITWYEVKSGGEWRVSSTRGLFNISEDFSLGDDPAGTGENGELPETRYGTEKSVPLPRDHPERFRWLDWHWDTGEDTLRTISVAGITWESTTGGGEVGFHSYQPLRVAIPYWLLLAITLFAPALVIHRALLRRRSARLGLCPYCNYDVRATPDRCPECGGVEVDRIHPRPISIRYR